MSFDSISICHDSGPAKNTVMVDMKTLKAYMMERIGLEEIKFKSHEEAPHCTRVYQGSTGKIPGLTMSGSNSMGIIVKTWTTYIDDEYDRRIQRAERDIGALKWLNRLGCQYVPKYICSFKMLNSYGLKEHVLVMEKVVGITLSDYSVGYACMSFEDKKTVRKAFETAVR